MCHGRIDIPVIEKRYALEFSSYFADALGKLEQLITDGLASSDAGQIAATSTGRLLLRIIAMCFDRYHTDAPANASHVV